MIIVMLVILLHLTGCVALERHGTALMTANRRLRELTKLRSQYADLRHYSDCTSVMLRDAERDIQRMHEARMREISMSVPSAHVVANIQPYDGALVASVRFPTVSVRYDRRAMEAYGVGLAMAAAEQLARNMHNEARKAIISAIADSLATHTGRRWT